MIRIVEVGPRDGLQNEAATIPTEVKVAFVDALAKSGVHEIEVSAFVSPKWVPQLSDAEEVFARIERRSGVAYSALVPNAQGLERALAARVDKIAVFTAASETFNQKNINTSIGGSLKRFAPVVNGAHRAKVKVRGYVSTAFWCPYEGRITPSAVLRVGERLLELGVDEVAVGDTIGKATRQEVEELLDVLLTRVPVTRLALHFHDTYGRAALNVLAGFARGVTTFDGSAGGLGGCPYAPGAPGNVATHTVMRTLSEAGADVQVDVAALAQAYALVSPHIGAGKLPLPQDRSMT